MADTVIRDAYTDGYGLWHVSARTEMEPEWDAEGNHRSLIERMETARKQLEYDATYRMRCELVEREMNTGETPLKAARRIRIYLKENPPSIGYYDVNLHNNTVTLRVDERGA
jgi:hypothetical protein